MKRLLAVLLALSLFASCGTLFVFATTPDEITTTPDDIVQPGEDASPCGLGYSQQMIYINDIGYTAIFSVAGTISDGCYSVFQTDARCIRYHYAVTVCYYTAGTGQETYSGGAHNYKGDEPDSIQGVYVGVTGRTTSNEVFYGGTDTATAIRSVKATGKLTTVNQNNSTQSYNFTAGTGAGT